MVDGEEISIDAASHDATIPVAKRLVLTDPVTNARPVTVAFQGEAKLAFEHPHYALATFTGGLRPADVATVRRIGTLGVDSGLFAMATGEPPEDFAPDEKDADTLLREGGELFWIQRTPHGDGAFGVWCAEDGESRPLWVLVDFALPATLFPSAVPETSLEVRPGLGERIFGRLDEAFERELEALAEKETLEARECKDDEGRLLHLVRAVCERILLPLMEGFDPTLVERLGPAKASLRGDDDWAWAMFELGLPERDLAQRQALRTSFPEVDEKEAELTLREHADRELRSSLHVLRATDGMKLPRDFDSTRDQLLQNCGNLFLLAVRESVYASMQAGTEPTVDGSEFRRGLARALLELFVL